MSGEADKKHVDWELIEKDYRAGIKTLRQIGGECGVSHTAIMKRADKGNWTRVATPAPTMERSISVTDVADEFKTPGFVYVIFFHTGSETFYKIGLANHLDGRLKSHQCSNPFEVRVAIAYFVPNMRVEERTLHQLFAAKRVRGEWFTLERHDLEAIAKRSLLA
jgi:hypothetical protein